jgi:hypothetical protein
MTTKRRFSFTRLISNAFPTLAASSSSDADTDLPITKADALFQHQISLPSPSYLSDQSFFIAGIADQLSLSNRIHKSLLKSGVILPYTEEGRQSGTGDTSCLPVNTVKIIKCLPNGLSYVSIYKQKVLINMLFFWQDECQRFRLLDNEEEDIRALMHQESERDINAEGGRGVAYWEELALRLGAVEIKRRLLPSKRTECANLESSGENIPRGSFENLLAYVQ